MNETIFKALCACLGLAPDSEQALGMIREAYTEPENSPQAARNTDVIYWSISPEQERETASYGTEVGGGFGHKPTVHRFSGSQLLVVCYGPSCESNARKIRGFLYIDGVNLPRGILRKAGIYPVPDPPAPQVMYEPEGSLWRRRADVVISLRVRETMVYGESRNAIGSAPAVVIHK